MELVRDANSLVEPEAKGSGLVRDATSTELETEESKLLTDATSFVGLDSMDGLDSSFGEIGRKRDCRAENQEIGAHERPSDLRQDLH